MYLVPHYAVFSSSIVSTMFYPNVLNHFQSGLPKLLDSPSFTPIQRTGKIYYFLCFNPYTSDVLLYEYNYLHCLTPSCHISYKKN